jgi:hypothetical protein
MPMDHQSSWENDVDHSGNKRSLTSYQIYTKGFIKNAEYIESELGNNMQVVLYKPVRTRLVETVYHQEERAANSKDITYDTKSNNTRRCIKHRL